LNIIVFGCSGQLGSYLIREFSNAGYKVVGTYNSNPIGSEKCIKINLKDKFMIEDLILKLKPDIIINAAAFTDVDACEVNRDECYQVNAEAVKRIVRASRVINSYLIHISTDYVFNGNNGYYKEDHLPDPVNFYGLSKLIGEAYALSYDMSAVIRTSGVFSSKKQNFPKLVVDSLAKGVKINATHEIYYSPIHALSLARCILKISDKKFYGLLHVAGERVSRYELALKIAELMGTDKELIIPVSQNQMSWKAKRPIDSSLDFSKAKTLIDFDFYSTSNNVKLLLQGL